MDKAKTYAANVADWKKVIIEDGEALVLMKEADIIGLGQASKQGVRDQIDGYHDAFLQCVSTAPDTNAGWDCYNQFEDQLIALEREAKRI